MTSLCIDLSGQVAFVTGGGGGLGRVLCRTLAACGADVGLNYFSDASSAEAVVREVRAMGRRGVVVSGDVGDAEDVARMATRVREQLGAPSIVVANAVVQIHPWRPILEEEPERFESQFRSCVLHAAHLARAFVPSMVEKGYGRVIGINTECSYQLEPTQAPYAAGKRGMDAVMRVLAREIGHHGITVNQVAPGWTICDADRESPPDDAAYVAGVPLGRRGTDQEVANVVAFLASQLASYVHGALVPVCGGNVMP